MSFQILDDTNERTARSLLNEALRRQLHSLSSDGIPLISANRQHVPALCVLPFLDDDCRMRRVIRVSARKFVIEIIPATVILDDVTNRGLVTFDFESAENAGVVQRIFDCPIDKNRVLRAKPKLRLCRAGGFNAP